MLNKAKAILKDNNHRLVIIIDDNITTSDERGVKTLLTLLDSNTNFSGGYAADKVVGKAAAMIYVLLGVKKLYADVISCGAKAIIEKSGIILEYGMVVPYIVNRAGNGMCPMEMAVGDETDPKKAVQSIRTRLKELSTK